MTTIETPICIIGAGPAGSTASMFLSQYGIPHVMADRATFPRDKVCGEVFSGRVPHVLKELGLDYKEMINQGILQETRHVRFVIQPEGKIVDYVFPDNLTSILKGKRSIFDDFMNAKARQSPLLTYLDNIHLNKFDRITDTSNTVRKDAFGEGANPDNEGYNPENSGGVLLTSDDGQIQIQTQLVLFCTGERVPFLHNILSDNYSSKGETLLIWRQYFKNVHFDISDYGCEAHFYIQPFSHYVIINPLPDNLALVEVAMTKADFHKHKISLESFFDATINAQPTHKAQFQYAIPLEKGKGTSMLLGKNPRLLSAERVLLAGSAAGSIHPFTGFGVGHAMRMGQLAAFHAAESLKANDFSASFLQAYDKEVRKRMLGDFRSGYILHFIMRHIRLVLPLIRLVIMSKKMTAFFATQSFKHLSLNPIFYLKKMVK
jgi:menaquinone-9 beta-reductase